MLRICNSTPKNLKILSLLSYYTAPINILVSLHSLFFINLCTIRSLQEILTISLSICLSGIILIFSYNYFWGRVNVLRRLVHYSVMPEGSKITRRHSTLLLKVFLLFYFKYKRKIASICIYQFFFNHTIL